MTKDQALKNLTKAVYNCTQAGIKIGVAEMFGSRSAWGIFMADVDFDGTKFTLADNSQGEKGNAESVFALY